MDAGMDTPVILVRVVETCAACPSQWDAWDASGRYYYLRFRHGRGTVEAYDNPEFWRQTASGRLVSRFEHGDPLDGYIELAEFCQLAGITLSDNAEVTSIYDQGSDQE